MECTLVRFFENQVWELQLTSASTLQKYQVQLTKHNTNNQTLAQHKQLRIFDIHIWNLNLHQHALFKSTKSCYTFVQNNIQLEIGCISNACGRNHVIHGSSESQESLPNMVQPPLSMKLPREGIADRFPKHS